jgi:hypothetical protein
MEDNMDYFLLNINRDEKNNVDEWIKGRSFAPIFYGNITIKQIIDGKGTRDARLFIDTFSEINTNATILSIGNSSLYIYKQKGKLNEHEEYRNILGGDLVKGFPIELLAEIEIKKCPLILVTIKSNRYMSAGAFRKLKPIVEKNSYFGNVLSVQYLLTNKIQEVKTFCGYLFCLSSLEFETLIAKIFEEKGYFVPAYKGGYIKNYDLFCRKNDQITSLQIKLEMEEKYHNETTDVFYCIKNNTIASDNIRDWASIKEELEKCPNTKKWLAETLFWVKLNEQ